MRQVLRYAGFAVVLLGLAIGGFAAASDGTGATQQTLTAPDVADSFVSAGGPDSKGSNGNATYLELDRWPAKTAYLKFTVSGLSGPPAAATLRLYTQNDSSTGFDVHAVSDTSWQESSLVAANAPAPAAAVTASSGPFGSHAWVALDVTPLIRGNGTFSIALTASGKRAIDLASRESGAMAPQILLSVASPTTTTTSTTRTTTTTSSSTTTTTTPTTTTRPTTTTTTTPQPPSGQQVFTFDLGWAPSSNIPWGDLTQIYLFNLATQQGPGLDK